MGRQIIRQPDGKFAVWSTIVDGFVMWDATPDEILAEDVADYRRTRKRQLDETVAELEAGGQPYYQFTMTLPEACRTHAELRPGEPDEAVDEFVSRGWAAP